jgi:DnaJ-class molecular chaperone
MNNGMCYVCGGDGYEREEVTCPKCEGCGQYKYFLVGWSECGKCSGAGGWYDLTT